ncbi:MAG: hypothetical protein Q7J27_09615, partial [Syntrophales bacterium]|nr:hypothetical protein [Syntrophales bacterium]
PVSLPLLITKRNILSFDPNWFLDYRRNSTGTAIKDIALPLLWSILHTSPTSPQDRLSRRSTITA